MANGNPKFGGTNNAPLLDVGQAGGVRDLAGVALATIRVLRNPAQVAEQLHHLPQQNVNVRDVLGFVGARVQWGFVLRTDTTATFDAIAAELDAYKLGSLWVAGVPGTLDPNRLRETQLTDVDGGIIGAKAILRDWNQVTPRNRNQEWGAIARMQIDFEIIG